MTQVELNGVDSLDCFTASDSLSPKRPAPAVELIIASRYSTGCENDCKLKAIED